MPSVSKKQQQFMGAELARKRKGKKTQTKMSESQLSDFAATKHSKLPDRAKSKRSNAKGGRRGRSDGKRRAARNRATY